MENGNVKVAYVLSVGEKTTYNCCYQLEQLGLKVTLLADTESKLDKYKKFINTANEDCLKVDADVIVNKRIKNAGKLLGDNLIVQLTTFCFYKNDKCIGQPTIYSKKALDIIKKNIDKLDKDRPETSAWRLPEINDKTKTIDDLYGMHGFFQDVITMERAKKHKIERDHIKDYDFELAFRLKDFYDQS